MNIKNIDTPYWLRNKRDTVSPSGKKLRGYGGPSRALEKVTVGVSEAIYDSDGDEILDSNGEPLMAEGTEQQFRLLTDVFSVLQDSDTDEIVDSDGELIQTKSINRTLLI